MRETRISPADEWYAPARDGMAAFFAELVRTARSRARRSMPRAWTR